MSDREILLRSLATVAARMGWSRRMPELGRLACALVALRLLAEVLETLGFPPHVLSLLAPVLVVAALAVVALVAWRLARPTTLAQAAGAADTRAGLKDELKSAHWFAQRPARDAFVELLLTRAARNAQRLDPRWLFPLGVPRSALAALVLAIFTGSLAWFSPRIALPVTPEARSSSAPAASAKADVDVVVEKEIEKIAAQLASPDATARHVQSPAWSQLEQMTKQLPAGAEEEAIRRAVAARDARLVAQLVQALQRKQAATAQQDPSARSGGEQMSADLAQGILEGLQEILKKEGEAAREPLAGASTEPTARVTQQVRENIREEQRKLSGTPAQGDIELNSRLRAVSRNSTTMRKVAYGEGEAADAGAQTSVDGTATGPPDGKSRAGGSSGEHPESSMTGSADMQPVLGEQPVRLEVRLQQVRVERDDDHQQQATEEEFYAATQRQAAQVGYENITAQWRAGREAVLPPSKIRLSYREAVKRYFLAQHGKEE